jgi:hypothetical protein
MAVLRTRQNDGFEFLHKFYPESIITISAFWHCLGNPHWQDLLLFELIATTVGKALPSRQISNQPMAID